MTIKELERVRMAGAVEAVGRAASESLKKAEIAAMNAVDHGRFERFEEDKKNAMEAWAEAEILVKQWRCDKELVDKME